MTKSFESGVAFGAPLNFSQGTVSSISALARMAGSKVSICVMRFLAPAKKP